jgi:hypothetical protein
MADKTRSELPYETYERLTGKKWTGGASASVKSLLDRYGIKAPAGSEQANNELQRALKRDKTLTENQPLAPMKPMASSPRNTTPVPKSLIDQGYNALKASPAPSALDVENEQMVKAGKKPYENITRTKPLVDTLATSIPNIIGTGADVGALPTLLGADAGAAPFEITQLAKYGWGSMPGKELTTEGAKALLESYRNPAWRANASPELMKQVTELLQRYYNKGMSLR